MLSPPATILRASTLILLLHGVTGSLLGDVRQASTEPSDYFALSSTQMIPTKPIRLPPSLATSENGTWFRSTSEITTYNLGPASRSSLYESRASYVPTPFFPCNASTNCSSQYGTSLPLVCTDGRCECPEPLCWIYTLDSSGFFVRYVFTCGECGQLGSECSGHQEDCKYPGHCGKDKFCHCNDGEHQGDVCFAHKGSLLLQFLIGSIVVFLILVVSVVIFQTILSYRHHNMICWCRHSTCFGLSHRHQQSGARRNQASSKTPAFTSQQRMYQNFQTEDEDIRHRSLISSGASEAMASTRVTTEAKGELVNDSVKSKSQLRDTEFNISLEQLPSETDVEATYHSTSTPSNNGGSDTSGMTEYFETFSNNRL